jgi:hypothetical protein
MKVEAIQKILLLFFLRVIFQDYMLTILSLNQ